MSKDCSFQTKQYEINESRCVIPLRLSKGNSWLCEFHNKENNCPIKKSIVKDVINKYKAYMNQQYGKFATINIKR